LAHDLHQHPLVHHQTLACLRLIGDQSQIGGTVHLVAVDAAIAERLTYRREKGFSADRGLAQAADIGLHLVGLFQQDAQERRRPRIAGRLQVRDGLHLELGLADACREDRAAQRLGAKVDHEAGRREVIGKRVVHQLPCAEPGCVEGAGHAPIVALIGLRIVDRAGGGEDARQLLHWHRCHSCERPIGLLQLDQLRFAGDRQPRQRGAILHVMRLDLLEQRGEVRRVPLRVDELLLQRLEQCALPDLAVARFQIVEVLVVCHWTHRHIQS